MNLSLCASRGYQRLHAPIRHLHRRNENVRSWSYVDPGIAHLRLPAIDGFRVVVDKVLAIPMSCSANLAAGVPILKAYEETIQFCLGVPPHHNEMIELSRRSIGASSADQGDPTGAEFAMRGASALRAVRILTARFHHLYIIPITGESLRQPGHFRLSRCGFHAGRGLRVGRATQKCQ